MNHEIFIALERDFTWRQHELYEAKSILRTVNKHEHQKKVMQRALIVLLYAHFEGFVKYCLTQYLDYICKSSDAKAITLKDELIVYSLKKRFSSLQGKSSLDNRIDFVNKIKEVFVLPLSLDDETIDTKSNLKSVVLNELFQELGIHLEIDRQKLKDIDTLVHRRNSVAHGENISMLKDEEFYKLEEGILFVMEEIASAIEGCIKQRLYIKQVN
ncbi:MAE_28990/MAE_18760 family HEPN-like nuclease [Paenibacillus silviterrae]|uniref:MAE_28990/MAE_18760 family HEPN-like nuclease n=1 Tax=Paenibacillus silviterrae TaxID=3242194 RepID=UPI002542D193|nr:MAE_28990/MAE_18760 family HEPN-like nuclease [Paenibacillus chinjuensis]